MSSFDGTTQCWIPDPPISRKEAPRLRIASFGGGYAQRTIDGINALEQTWGVTFENRSALDLEAMRDYLETRKGYAFDFADPGTGDIFQVVCDEWEVNWSIRRPGGSRYGTLSAEFKRVNGLTISFPPEVAEIFVPGDLWSHGETGFLFDFAKTDRSFQDIQGQTVADSTDEPIGLHFDQKSWAGQTLAQVVAAGTNLVVNGTFASDTTWVKGVGWTIASGVASVLDATTTLAQNVAPTNEMVKITYTISSFTTGNMRSNVTGENGLVRTLAGTFNQYALATGTGFNFSGSVISTLSIDNVTMKRVPGSHCRQITAAARPLRKTGYLQFDTTDDNLLLVPTLAPSTAYSIMIQGNVPTATVDRYMMGARLDANSHAGIFVQATTGFLCGVTGSTVIVSDINVINVKGVAALVAQAGFQTLYWNGTAVAAGEYTGGPTTTVAYRLGALNNNGTVTGFTSGMALYKAAAINRAWTPTEVVNLSAWMEDT